MFAHLLGLQRRLGKDAFPLIDQTFYPNHREMVSAKTKIYINNISIRFFLLNSWRRDRIRDEINNLACLTNQAFSRAYINI